MPSVNKTQRAGRKEMMEVKQSCSVLTRPYFLVFLGAEVDPIFVQVGWEGRSDVHCSKSAPSLPYKPSHAPHFLFSIHCWKQRTLRTQDDGAMRGENLGPYVVLCKVVPNHPPCSVRQVRNQLLFSAILKCICYSSYDCLH